MRPAGIGQWRIYFAIYFATGSANKSATKSATKVASILMDGDCDTAASRLRALRAAMLGCVRCDVLVRCRTQVVPGHGAAPATVAFVGLAPGRRGGDGTGIPFSGDRSGELLRLMIARADLGRVFITNVVRCNPRDGRGRNRDPSAREIANCRDHLTAELAAVRPRVVVCLGAVAWRETAGHDAPFRPRRPVTLRSRALRPYPRYPPAFIVCGAYSVQAYARDFARLGRLISRLAGARRHTVATAGGTVFRPADTGPIWEC